ncbi:hypothetical protein Glove_108g5 [Diversispora epigaea]|uniref:Cyclin N-terminal domain-containing protein n=1 Tax=Diversispora epigaea TaxID=1348612 RepID=A0A397J6G8_9GLOM|nr:hypothetical protein Glove_108g5 [Diversispora epigaea]
MLADLQQNMPSSGHVELGEFVSSIAVKMYKVWTGNNFNVCPVRNEEFKKFCIEILNLTNLSSVTVFVALKYLERYMKCYAAIDFGIERLFLISLLIADRYVNDTFFSIKRWALNTALPPEEINRMQVMILNNLNYDIYINGNDYLEWINQLSEHIKAEEKLYTDPPKYIKTIMDDITNQRSLISMKIKNQVHFIKLPSGIIHRYTPEVQLPSGIVYRYSPEYK